MLHIIFRDISRYVIISRVLISQTKQNRNLNPLKAIRRKRKIKKFPHGIVATVFHATMNLDVAKLEKSTECFPSLSEDCKNEQREREREEAKIILMRTC